MNKTIIAIVVVAIVVLGGYFLFRGTYQPASLVPQTSDQQPVSQPSASEPPTQQPVSEPSAGQTPAAEKNIVIYTDTGYSPNTITVKVGESVSWKNQSSKTMWAASAAHPTHRVYPTTGGCLGSTFDACQGVQVGDSWSFKFDIAGAWKYHNHLSPGDTGTIIVQ